MQTVDQTTMMGVMMGQFTVQMAQIWQQQQQQQQPSGVAANAAQQEMAAKSSELKKDLMDEDLLASVMGFSGIVDPEKIMLVWKK
mmetsp:Transcript_1361/g.3011  ORF Transcript_1361/g.3011 Transcript_1361/m.3011 type:complete len:85 (+) Transcript_1361:39-293(+)